MFCGDISPAKTWKAGPPSQFRSLSLLVEKVCGLVVEFESISEIVARLDLGFFDTVGDWHQYDRWRWNCCHEIAGACQGG